MKPVREEPCIDVLLPVYNASAYLRTALESLQLQTFQNFRVIMIDDGSTDNSLAILQEVAKADARFEVHTQTNCGVTETLNRALSLSRAPFVARQDADDISLKDRFHLQYEYLNAHPEVVALSCDYQKIIGERPDYIREMPTTHEQITFLMMSRNCLVHGGMMIRRGALLKASGYRKAPDTSHVEDFDAWVRLMQFGQLASLPQILYHHRQHPQAVSVLALDEQNANALVLSKQLIDQFGRSHLKALMFTLKVLLQLRQGPSSGARRAFLHQHFRIAAVRTSERQWPFLARCLNLCVKFTGQK